MDPLLKKLNFKDHKEVLLLHLPETLQSLSAQWSSYLDIVRDTETAGTFPFALAFVSTQQELDRLAPLLAEKVPGDGLLWLAYPKGSSKRYKSDINRDNGWGVLGKLGFEPVRQVAIDEDWSALRFRRAGYIHTMTRSREMAMSEEGRKKTKGN